ncbi:MAG TPA: carbonic anhydrase [Roseiarcus sp.]|nr:carbonic anhydrase [Roseiarcus sp.]
MSEETEQQAAGLPDHLLAGYRAFVAGRLPQEQARFRDLAERGQSPRVLVIGCCDSRVSPEAIFGAGPGELFVARNVANLVPPYGPDAHQHGTSAALEYAVMGLRVEHVVVMGHAQCGGVTAYVQNEIDPYSRPLSAGDFIGQWMTLIAPAAKNLGPPSEPIADYIERLAKESIRQSLRNLRSFPWVKTLEERDKLKLHGAYFGVADGRLQTLDETSGAFAAVFAAF